VARDLHDIKKDVFKNWVDDQVVFNRVRIDSMFEQLSKKNITKLKKRMKKQIIELQAMAGFFNVSILNDFLARYSLPSEKELQRTFAHIYSLLERDIGQLVEYLRDNGVASEPLNKIENKQGINTVSKKHEEWVDFLFDQEDDEGKDEFLFTVANNFFEYCFNKETFLAFKKMLKTPKDYPIVRFFYSVMWSNLAEIGWQHWHGACLAGLREQADAGKEIVYVAGGTDIYQLIKHGIYNIRVIDPLLPTQPKYYSQGWDWFIKGEGPESGIGERALVPCGQKNLFMERIDYKAFDKTFTVQLSNKKKETFEQSETTWHIFDKREKFLGEVVFERRLTNQDDFDVSKNQVVLLSFNELYFVAAPRDCDGWGIDPKRFNENIKIFVKQLEKPVNKQVMCNMRHEIRQEDFAFIELGSCIN